jgi:hypothetical protein
MSGIACCSAVAGCGAAATYMEHLDFPLTLAHPRRDLAIPFTEIEGRPKLLRHFLFFQPDRIAAGRSNNPQAICRAAQEQ